MNWDMRDKVLGSPLEFCLFPIAEWLNVSVTTIEVNQQLATLVLGWVNVGEKPQCCSSVDECIDLAGTFLGQVSALGRKLLHWSMNV